VVATAGTLREVAPALPRGCATTVVSAGAEFDVGDLTVSVFAVSHDAAEPVGYSVSDGERRVAVATDLGVVGPDAREHLLAADCVVLEHNHDERMLLDGPYPWHLKQRILGDAGHLSNGAASREIERLSDGPLATLVLAHLSRRNNTPDLAHEAAVGALERAGRTDVRVLVGDPFAVVGPFEAAALPAEVPSPEPQTTEW
jgi:phosphoribosyl 1,2-cyclic phosphodiesterase